MSRPSSPATPITAENYFDLLNLFSEVVVSDTDVDGVLRSTVKLIQRLVAVERCSILLLDAAGEHLVVGAAAGIPEDVLGHIRVKMGEGVAGRVAQTRRAIFKQGESRPLRAQPPGIGEASPAPSPSPPSSPPSPGAAFEEDPRYTSTSYISVPIQHLGRLFGVLNVTNKHRGARLNQSDLALIQAVTRFLGLSMEKNRLRGETEFLHLHLERTIEQLPVGLLTVRADGTLLTINPVATRLLNPRRGCASHRPVGECFSRETAYALTSLLDAAVRLRTPQSREIEVEGSKPSAPRVPVRLTSCQVESPEDHPAEVLLLVEDLTLRHEVRELRRLDELKSNFISMISHELRTPLTSIRGANHLLASYYAANLDDTQRHLLRIVSGNTERLISLVNNILDISLLDNQALHVEFAPLDIHRVLRAGIAGIRQGASEKRIDIEGPPDETPLQVWGDAERLEQVVGQVLDNALKFTPTGGHIRMRTRTLDDMAQIDILDSGEGIPVEFREKVFEKFFQGDKTLTRRTSGTGIGLYLARALVELHGGTIKALEAEFAGACIRILLPLETSPHSPKHRSIPPT